MYSYRAATHRKSRRLRSMRAAKQRKKRSSRPCGGGRDKK